MMAPASNDDQRDVETLLYAEARMLEDGRFNDWLECFTEDVYYWMPVREHVQHQVDAPGTTDAFALFDDDFNSLSLRIQRLQTGMAACETPLSVTQRLVTNVMATQAADGAELTVYSTFMVYQERRGRHGVTFFGRREDRMRRIEGNLKIAYRKIVLAQMILPSTISIFF